MRFRIWTILWVFAVLASAMATFGGGALFLVPIVIWLWAIVLNKPRSTLVNWLIGFAILVVLAALILPAISSVRGASRRNACVSNMKQLAMSLLNYESDHGRFPPAYIADAAGRPMHSWRVLILPYLDNKVLYDRYDFEEPWDSPNNKRLVTNASLYPYFECPTHYSEPRLCHYFAIVGKRTMWPPDRRRKHSEVRDGHFNTILYIEAPHKRIPWAKPEDLSFDEAVKLLSDPPKDEHFGHEVDEGFFYKPSSGINVAFVDGHVHLLRLPISRDQATALLTVDGGELLDPREVRRLKNPELDYARIYSLTVFGLLSLLPLSKLIVRRRKVAAI